MPLQTRYAGTEKYCKYRYILSIYQDEIIAIGFLLLSILGTKGKKDEKMHYKTALSYLIWGSILYFTSQSTADFHIVIASSIG
jgi:hypothetical protein